MKTMVARDRDHWTVSFNGNVLEVSAVLADMSAVDQLIKVLELSKALLPEISEEDDSK